MKTHRITLLVASAVLLLSSFSFITSAAPRGVIKKNGPAAGGVIRPRPKPGPTPGKRHVRKERHKKVYRKVRRDRWRTAAATTLTASAFRSLNCRTVTVVSRGITYYQRCNTWYRRGYSSGTIVYIQTTAP